MIPSSISLTLISLLANVNAAYPLATATVSALAAMQQQAANLIVSIDAALLADDPNVTLSDKFLDPLPFAAAITALVSVAQEETKLAELSALAGRAAINIANAGV